MLDYLPIFKCSLHHCQRRKGLHRQFENWSSRNSISLSSTCISQSKHIKKSAHLTQKNGKIIMDIHLWCCQEAKDRWRKAESKQSSIMKPKILLEVPLLSLLKYKRSKLEQLQRWWWLKTTHPDAKNLFSMITTSYLNTKNQITLHSVNFHRCRKPAGGSVLSPIFSPILEPCVVA